MAENIVSPGVFTQEKDLSFLPQGIGEIGAALIGPTVKGPAFVPTVVESFNEFEQIFGGLNEKMYVPYTAQNYLQNAGRATIVRVLGTTGYQLSAPLLIVASGSYGRRLVNVLHPTYVVTTDGTTDLYEGSLLASNSSGSFVLTVSGSFVTDSSTFTALATNNNGTAYSASLDAASANYIGDVFGYNPEGQGPAYNYVNFKKSHSASLAEDPGSIVEIVTGSAQEWNFNDPYLEASTPWIMSQQIGGVSSNLFRVHTLSHGSTVNFETKIAISNIKPAGTIAGTNYGSFTLQVRKVDQNNIHVTPYTGDDSDTRPNVVEVFDNVNLDPDSPDYIARRIGDKYITVDANGKVSTNGDWQNLSKYIRVEVHAAVEAGAYSDQLMPFGFRSLVSPIPSGFARDPQAATFVTAQSVSNIYNRKKFWGFDYDFSNTDNLNYLKPLPDSTVQTTGSNTEFYLGNYNQSADAGFPTTATAYSGSINLNTTQTGVDARKFMVPFQGGNDGFKPNIQRKTAEHITAGNTQGFDLQQNADGYTGYRKALAAISNQDEYDINMLVLPGVIHRLHSGVTTKAQEVVEDRGDAFYVMDGFSQDDNISAATNAVAAVDSNYIGVYYPWIKILDTGKNKPVWVPPSVSLPGVMAYTDRVSHPWYAPAGLNRGGITEAIDVKTRLTKTERDELYESRVNPITAFPGDGIVVWGQKDLQARPSALDRINVRRLLIAAKKFIASTSRFLVFEQNTAATRNRFLNIANPYFESVQQRQGLSAFRVVMDESNNGPDVIDRNILFGQIYLQPTRTAEFIVLDFNVLPTGATFPEA